MSTDKDITRYVCIKDVVMRGHPDAHIIAYIAGKTYIGCRRYRAFPNDINIKDELGDRLHTWHTGNPQNEFYQHFIEESKFKASPDEVISLPF